MTINRRQISKVLAHINRSTNSGPQECVNAKKLSRYEDITGPPWLSAVAVKGRPQDRGSQTYRPVREWAHSHGGIGVGSAHKPSRSIASTIALPLDI